MPFNTSNWWPRSKRWQTASSTLFPFYTKERLLFYLLARWTSLFESRCTLLQITPLHFGDYLRVISNGNNYSSLFATFTENCWSTFIMVFMVAIRFRLSPGRFVQTSHFIVSLSLKKKNNIKLFPQYVENNTVLTQMNFVFLVRNVAWGYDCLNVLRKNYILLQLTYLCEAPSFALENCGTNFANQSNEITTIFYRQWIFILSIYSQTMKSVLTILTTTINYILF